MRIFVFIRCGDKPTTPELRYVNNITRAVPPGEQLVGGGHAHGRERATEIPRTLSGHLPETAQ